MPAPSSIAWSLDSALLIELDPVDGDAPYRVVGLPEVSRASARIMQAGVSGGPRSLLLRPLVDPPGPFSAEGILMFSPFRETDADRTRLAAFERRIGPRYYEFLLAARHRYAATCAIDATGIEAPGTCAELYSIDATTMDEALALDEANRPPADIVAIFDECRTFIVPGSHRRVWLVPDGR